METKLTGFYLGIVVQNDDPEKRGRIKVFIPHISANLYTSLTKNNNDYIFRFPDKETNPDLTNIMDELKAVLPWAEYAAPPFGGSALGKYNAIKEKGTTSDSTLWTDEGNLEEGGRPLQLYTGLYTIPDAFTETDKNKNKFVNQYSYQYTPSDYSNMARGLFTIPNVGSHVWVWFIEGDFNYPVYFAVSYGQEDFKRIYTMNRDSTDNTSVDYPASYENKSKNESSVLDSDAKTFRSKTVLNSNKHAIELIDTDLREILKFTHYSGSFLEFCNYATIQLSTNNDQKMVMGDQFLTVRKNQSIYVAQAQEVIIGGDTYLTIGTLKPDDDNLKEYIGIIKELNEYHRLFDIQRVNYIDPPNNTSIHQKRVGITKEGIGPGEFYKNGFVVCPICNNKKYTQTIWTMTPTFVWNCQEPVMIPPIQPVSEFIDKQGYYLGLRCDICNSTYYDKDTYLYDHYKGYSPSSFGGKWNYEPNKQKVGDGASPLEKLIIEKQKELDDYAQKFGMGGDYIVDISKNKIETIGAAFNDMPSFRVDPIGKLRIDSSYVAPEGTYETYKPSPHIENTYIQDYPGGDYNLTVGNKLKILVGSKGINIKSTGPIEMVGSIVNIAGEQVNIGSKNEVNIDGGERYFLRARKIAFTPYEHNAVVVDGQLHVTRNAIIRGGLMQEGELGVLHITAPGQWYDTTQELKQEGISCVYENVVIDGTPGHVIMMPPHIHRFAGIAATLLSCKEQVRDFMNSQGINNNDALIASQEIGGTGSGYDPAADSYLTPKVQKAIDQYCTSINSSSLSHGSTYKRLTRFNLVTTITQEESGETKKIVEYKYTYNIDRVDTDNDTHKFKAIATCEYDYNKEYTNATKVTFTVSISDGNNHPSQKITV